MRHLDLFSGIGGFALGLQMAGGFETVAFCEIDSYCQKVLKKHWPDVPVYEDITTLDYEQFIGQADIITAGFPCQDLSLAGRGAGLAGERSGLYRYAVDAIRVARPCYAILENVAALLTRGLGVILGELAEIGYDAEWHCIPASTVGAPHQRDRIWVVAYPNGERPPIAERGREDAQRARVSALIARSLGGRANDGWSREPDVHRVVDGLPDRVDRVRGLGNAVVPQIVEILGRAILEADRGL